MAEVILPGIYITVHDEGLVSVGGVASGNIGVVGTAEKGDTDRVYIVGSLNEAKEIFGTKESVLYDTLNKIYSNGGKTVYAVKAKDDSDESLKEALSLLENQTVNIALLAGQDSSKAEILSAHINATAQIKRERIGIIEAAEPSQDITNNIDSDRIVLVAPAAVNAAGQVQKGGLAASVAGLISSLPVQTSPTNKTITLSGIKPEFNSAQLEKLIQSRVLAVENREGYRIVKGITTSTNSAWHQITTRRIVDYAVFGVRSGCNPYIGKLNNERVRSAMKATLDGFLSRMVESEALVEYKLEVSATRAQQIAGQCKVNVTLAPTFSIDFIMVDMYLG